MASSAFAEICDAEASSSCTTSEAAVRSGFVGRITTRSMAKTEYINGGRGAARTYSTTATTIKDGVKPKSKTEINGTRKYPLFPPASPPAATNKPLASISSSASAPPPAFAASPPSGPPPLLRLSIPILLLASVLAELLTLSTALAAYVAFRLLTSDYGRRAIWTLPRDAKGLVVLIKIKWKIRCAFRLNEPIHAYLLQQLRRHPEKECVVEVESGRVLTFAQFNAHTNAYAHLFKSLPFDSSDVLALFMENGIEFFAAWVGLSKLGIVTAWINNNLKGEPMGHSIRIAQCKAVLTTPTLLPVLQRAIALGHLSSNLPIFVVLEGNAKVRQLDAAAAQLADAQKGRQRVSLPREYPLEDSEEEPPTPDGLTFKSILCYIYTSGTTGTPKAAIIRHYRCFLLGMASGVAFDIQNSDRLYLTLPMYHSAGGILGISQVLIRGCSVCIRSKFSASNFWRDCIRFDCTISQYIGEICRYLLAQPPSPVDRAHPIRLLIGNGLRPQIWRDFVKRFGIAKICEFYGSTEGNSNLVNIDNRTGACGFKPIYTFLQALYPLRLLRICPESGQLVRDHNGFCVQCMPGDTGELVGTIREDPMLHFDGYVNRDATQKKLILDCQFPGDTVFTTGDVMHWDRLGYLYFKDRLGDTYRWRGENVSTTEVEGVLQSLKGIGDVTVYGVEVPGREGRAGMIGLSLTDAVVTGNNLEDFLDQLSTRLVDQLAPYAIPVFLRVCDHVDQTGTFKLKKTRLQCDGYDLDRCAGNRVYYWDAGRRLYASLDSEMQARIDNGNYTKI